MKTDSSQPVTWQTPIEVSGVIYTDWSVVLSGKSGEVDASGVWYNETISAGSPAEFGYCAER